MTKTKKRAIIIAATFLLASMAGVIAQDIPMLETNPETQINVMAAEAVALLVIAVEVVIWDRQDNRRKR